MVEEPQVRKYEAIALAWEKQIISTFTTLHNTVKNAYFSM